MVCKKAPGKIARHQVLNDVIWRVISTRPEYLQPRSHQA